MTPTIDAIKQDHLALAVAQALTVANGEAIARGMDPGRALVTITEASAPPNRVWRVHYGPRDYIRRRGGDLLILIDERTSTVQSVMRGQ